MSEPTTWTIALAGGEGTRLQDYVERRFGKRMPKQYCAIDGDRTMIQQTIDRLAPLAPAGRTLAVIGTNHAELAMPQLAGRANVLRQPESRDTGIAIYVALAVIRRKDPDAVVIITPTDQHISPDDKYAQRVHRAVRLARHLGDRVVLLGALPDRPESDLGYVVPGDPILGAPGATHVEHFEEKPDEERAAELCARGALWNTMVTVAHVQALWHLAAEVAPEILAPLERITRANGDDVEQAIADAYRELPSLGFSRDLLERAPQRLVALPMSGIEWSDWGTPERIEEGIQHRRDRAAVR